MSTRRVWLITGSAGGLGRPLCHAVLGAGDTVICAVRERDQIADLLAEFPDRAIASQMDVADAASVNAAVAKVPDINVLVNCAGLNVIAAAEEIDEKTAKHIFDVNFFGAFRLIRAVLPGMRARRQGIIVNMSSMGGFVGFPALSLYSASKFALEGFSEALAGELRPFGIRVHVVEPGPFRTAFRARSMIAPPRMPDYAGTMGPLWDRMASGGQIQAGDPDKAAKAILTLVNAPDAPFRLPLGNEAVDRMRAKLTSLGNEIDTWEALARSTDFQ